MPVPRVTVTQCFFGQAAEQITEEGSARPSRTYCGQLPRSAGSSRQHDEEFGPLTRILENVLGLHLRQRLSKDAEIFRRRSLRQQFLAYPKRPCPRELQGGIFV
jgi:hypothetical protein